MSPQDLYSLLGLAADTDVEHLRSAYEGAVEAAANRHDWARAKALSAAFDLLPASTRQAIYPGRERSARRWDAAAETSAWGAPDSSARPRGISGQPRGASAQPLVRWGVVLRTVVSVVLVALVGAAALHQLSHDRKAGSSVAVGTVPQLLRPGSAPWRPSYPPVPQSPTARSWPSLTTVIRMWTDPGIGNTGQTIGGLPLWTTPASIPLDAAGLAVMRCSAVRANGPGPWSRIDPRVSFTCPPGSGPEYLGNP